MLTHQGQLQNDVNAAVQEFCIIITQSSRHTGISCAGLPVTMHAHYTKYLCDVKQCKQCQTIMASRSANKNARKTYIGCAGP